MPEVKNDLAPKGVSEAEVKVREELAAERAARVQTERILAARGSAPPPPKPTEPDFLGKFKEDAALPDGQADSLARGIAQRARGVVAEMVGPELGKVRQELEAARYEARIESFRERHPELDDDKFAAAIGAANREMQAKGIRLQAADHMRLVEEKARLLFPAKESEKKVTAETPPFVEGASNANRAEVPGGAAKMSEDGKPEEGEAHPLAEFYFGEGSDVPVFNHDKNLNGHLKDMVEDHVQKKNDFLMGKGVKSFMPKVAGPMYKRLKDKAKAAKAASAGR
jgi:hypothetical protein